MNSLSQCVSCMRFNLSMILLKGDVLCPCLQPAGLGEERVKQEEVSEECPSHPLFP